MEISALSSLMGHGISGATSSVSEALGVDNKDAKPDGKSFSQYVKDSFDNVNQLLQTSDKKTTEMAIGKSENLHEAMIGFEKAETAFKLLVQVRNKALDAYHEIMRMQV